MWHSFLTDDKPKITRALLLRVLRYAKPYWRHIGGMALTILLSAGIGVLSPLIFRHLIDEILPSKDLRQLTLFTLTLFLIPLVSGGLGVLQRRLNAQVGEGVIYDLRTALFAKLQRMSLRFFTQTKSGELMSRLNNDVVGAQNAINNSLLGIVTNLAETIAITAVMFSLEWRLTLAAIFILPLFYLVSRAAGNALRDIARVGMDLNAQMNAHMNETLNIGGALLVKLFGRAHEEETRFQERAARVRDIGARRAVIGSAFFTLLGLSGAIGSALVYGLGGYYVINGQFTTGAIVAFVSYLGSLYGALQGLASAPIEFSTSLVSFERVFEALDLPQDIEEKNNAIDLQQPQGNLEFQNVSFRYEADESKLLKDVKRYGKIDDVRATLSGQEKRAGEDSPAATAPSQARSAALTDVSFSAKNGQLIALVGPSGAGKTTISYLIPRLYDPSEGVIRLDGNDLRDLTLSSISRAVGMVTQENYLFHDTIRTNLIYAKPNASQTEIEAAAQAANIHHFIMGLPNQYETIVGERGYRLSGGEKQRIALARVILKDPRILVLDEATSHLDSESEALIQDALKRVMAGRTSIVIAHRLSTILAADLILVIDRGKIIERGTHAELLKLNGLYAQLFETQFKG